MINIDKGWSNTKQQKFIPPKNGELITKVSNESDYYWCDNPHFEVKQKQVIHKLYEDKNYEL